MDRLMKKTTKQILISSILGAGTAFIVSLLCDYCGVPKNIVSYIIAFLVFMVISYFINKFID